MVTPETLIAGRAKTLALRLSLLLATAITLNSCTGSQPTTTVVGTAVSPDGRQALTLFAVVPGSILEDYLALNLSQPGAPYSERQTLASFSSASELRAFWAQTGRPVIVARALTGTVFPAGKAARLVVCRDGHNCPNLEANAPRVSVRSYPSE